MELLNISDYRNNLWLPQIEIAALIFDLCGQPERVMDLHVLGLESFESVGLVRDQSASIEAIY
jgi:hypothetical protein